jgi:hypothetical protein
MVAMPIVRLVLKINVMKMEQAFQMGYREGENTFYVSPQNWQGKTKFTTNFVKFKSSFWKLKSEKFEAFLKTNVNLSSLCGKMFHV